ncbi:hypothetical protein EHS13_17215 [Paenibacillus psychroresistens]|uniref:Uncharacterized protein n=1 Tax=Paenibacillus psychroresistens TaxID=1778678 RepID=A0A6B8RJQ5_9BACL|nr:hypothetical protein [Paenibacillus psychroresistens]QGQ96500.1 hypothetical protein EHS13_17215 [Paenibacillus psychroresistens]
MSQASIPDITPDISITIGQTIPLLLASIALEEIALAHIINAEAEKIQFVLGTLSTENTLDDTTITISNLLLINQSVSQTMRDVIKKEMLLQFKLDTVFKLYLQDQGALF